MHVNALFPEPFMVWCDSRHPDIPSLALLCLYSTLTPGKLKKQGGISTRNIWSSILKASARADYQSHNLTPNESFPAGRSRWNLICRHLTTTVHE